MSKLNSYEYRKSINGYNIHYLMIYNDNLAPCNINYNTNLNDCYSLLKETILCLNNQINIDFLEVDILSKNEHIIVVYENNELVSYLKTLKIGNNKIEIKYSKNSDFIYRANDYNYIYILNDEINNINYLKEIFSNKNNKKLIKE